VRRVFPASASTRHGSEVAAQCQTARHPETNGRALSMGLAHGAAGKLGSMKVERRNDALS
jgi:hypothetical protein